MAVHAQSYEEAERALNYISLLEEGWLEGLGEEFDEKVIAASYQALESFRLNNICTPFIYPEESGNIIFEWDLGARNSCYDVSIELNSNKDIISAQSTNVEKVTHQVEKFELGKEVSDHFFDTCQWLKKSISKICK